MNFTRIAFAGVLLTSAAIVAGVQIDRLVNVGRLRDGQRTEAVVIDQWSQNSFRRGGTTAHYVCYEFEVNGQRIRNTARVTEDDYKRIGVSKGLNNYLATGGSIAFPGLVSKSVPEPVKIGVVYSTETPEHNLPPSSIGLEQTAAVVWLLASCGVIALVGVAAVGSWWDNRAKLPPDPEEWRKARAEREARAERRGLAISRST